MLNVKTSLEAQNLIFGAFGDIRTENEKACIQNLLVRTLAEDIVSSEDIPGFNRSTVDGYAVKASDTFGASESVPAMLKFQCECVMGEEPPELLPGYCMYVPTGGEMPKNADAMVMIEDSDDYGDGLRYVTRPTSPGRHIIFRGDDAARDGLLIPAGKRLRPQDIGTLAAAGVSIVNVKKKPVVGIISTGDELVDIDCDTGQGAKIRDVNAYSLYAGVLAAGGEPRAFGIIHDDFNEMKAALLLALSACDALLVSGGTSVGTRDHVVPVFEVLTAENGGHILFHGLAMKPGKPTAAAEIGGKPVFALPGHPIAAYMIFQIFVKPLIINMLGGENQTESLVAVLTANIPSNHGREECVPVKIIRSEQGVNLCAAPLSGKSGLISVLTKADGYIRIPRDSEGLAADTSVKVYLF